MTIVKQIQDGICGKYAAEAIFFLFKIGEAMLDPSVRLYIYRSICLQEYSNSPSSCQTTLYEEDHEEHIQAVSANYIMAYKILLNCPVIILGLFCGAWSDHVGRKLPVVMACTGSIFAVLLFMTSIIKEVPTIPLVLAGSALRGMFGKSAVVTMAMHSYITDHSTKEERTRRLGMLLGMNFLGYFVGSLLTGLLLEWTTFDVIFCIVIVMYACCVLIALVCMREVMSESSEFLRSKPCNPFDFKHVRESLDVIFRPRLNHDRLYIWFIFTCIVSQQLTKSGEVDITLLFTKRSPLNWGEALYGYFLAADYAALGVAVLILLPLLVYFLRPHDLCLMSAGIIFKAIRLLFMAFADRTWLVFLSVFIGCPSGMIASSGKSLVSKIVSEDEVGKVFSLLSCLEAVSNLVGTVIFTNIYTATASKLFPGFTFALDAGFYCILLASVSAVWYDMRSSANYYLLEGVKLAAGYGSTKAGKWLAGENERSKNKAGAVNRGFDGSNDEELIDVANDVNPSKDDGYTMFKSESELLPLTEEKEMYAEDQGTPREEPKK